MSDNRWQADAEKYAKKNDANSGYDEYGLREAFLAGCAHGYQAGRAESISEASERHRECCPKSYIEAQQENARLRDALELIACPMRPDGTFNRDRDACRRLAAVTLEDAQDRLASIEALESVEKNGTITWEQVKADT